MISDNIEAELRTYNVYQPFAEEVNRRITGIVASWHFAPTRWDAENLRQETVDPDRILVTGNTVIDAIRQVAAMPFDPQETVLGDLPLGENKIIFITAHRRESFGSGLEEICAALKDIAAASSEIHLVYPVHLNPKAQEPVPRLLGKIPNITLLPPLDYLSLVHLLKHSSLVLTDSGGIQEEAPSLGVPVLILRDVTERPEGVEAGTARLVDAHREWIISKTLRLLRDNRSYRKMCLAVNTYGEGRAAKRILAALLGNPVDPWQDATY